MLLRIRALLLGGGSAAVVWWAEVWRTLAEAQISNYLGPDPPAAASSFSFSMSATSVVSASSDMRVMG